MDEFFMTNNRITIIKLSFECLLSARPYAENSKDIFHLIIKIILRGVYYYFYSFLS